MTETRFYHPVKASGPCFSFGQKKRSRNLSDVPGPGAYESPPKLASETKGTKFNSSNRELPM